MSKLLSQEEIDALLSQDGNPAPAEDEVAAEKEYRLYDFRRAERISKDQQRFLRNIHENFAKLLSTYLSNKLRSMIEVKSPIIDQVSYLEFTMSSAEFTNLYIFEIEKLDGQAILEIDPSFTNFVIDRLFGGEGKVINRGSQITIIEETVMTQIAKQILKSFQEAWIHEDLKPEITMFETNPQLVTIAPASETMLILNFPISARNYDFYIYLCFPYFMMEPVLKKLISDTYMQLLKKNITPEDREIVQRRITLSSIDLSVQISNTDITVEEFLDLQENDILVLNQATSDMLKCKVGNNDKFLGTVGKSGKNRAFRIEQYLDSEGEPIYD